MAGSDIEKCLTFINVQINPPTPDSRREQPGTRPLVTLSRQTGAGHASFPQMVADVLNARQRRSTVPWTVFDKNLVERVLDDHQLPASIAGFLGERWHPSVTATVEELLGLHPPAWRMIQQTTETILGLAALGRCILVGRGATVITQHFPKALHVRLVGSRERRARTVRQEYGLTEREAFEYIDRMDAERRLYLRRYFRTDPDDPLLYHLMLNTDRVSAEESARLVGDAVLERAAEPAMAPALVTGH